MRQNGESLDWTLRELTLNAALYLSIPGTLSKSLNISGLQFVISRIRIKYFSHMVDLSIK